ncbi:MAG: histidine phosphatase family protein [bacterium]|nr:histidine phosphatase family protein [bacterium]
MKTALLTIVRHGETPANAGGVWHGSIDTPLSDRGHEQARAVGAHLSSVGDVFTRVYSSPLQRARHTAEAIALGLDLEVHEEPGLTEYDLGSWEGKTYKELYTEHKLWDHMKDDPHFAPHGGESPLQVVTRYCSALREIAQSHPGERVIVVGHGGALSMAFAELTQGAYQDWGRVMDNCGVSDLRLDPRPVLERFNFTEHLEGI